jgi:hypothetical protein
MSDSIDPHYGSAVGEGQRFPRPELEGKIIRWLEGANGVAMFGLRRIGKSTLARYAEDKMRAKGYLVVDVDAQGCRAVDRLLLDLLTSLAEDKTLSGRLVSWAAGTTSLPNAVRTTLQAILKRTGLADTAQPLSGYWQLIAQQISTALQSDKRKLLVSIDEFPFMCRGILEEGGGAGKDTVNQLLAALRQWRGANVKMLLTGSIGMAAIERKFRIDPVHLNDLKPLDVPPLSAAEARKFVAALAKGKRLATWTDQHTAALLDETIALYPSFLQFAFLHLAGDPAPEVGAIPGIFANEIRPDLDATFLDQFDSRVTRYRDLGDGYFGDEVWPLLNVLLSTDAQMCVLSSLTEAAGQNADSIAVSRTLRLLREDGFVSMEIDAAGNQTWRVSSPLVTAWWRQRGLGLRR